MPRPHLSGNPLDLSFSGLKTSAVNLIHNAGQKGEQIVIPDLCAAFSEAVCGMLVPRAMLALEQTGGKRWPWRAAWPPTAGIRAALQRETAAPRRAPLHAAAVAVRRQRRDDRRAGVL